MAAEKLMVTDEGGDTSSVRTAAPCPGLVISLDFELHWGVTDTMDRSEHPYAGRLHGAREAIPRLLEIFEQRGVRATWATVGKLFARGREDLERSNPEVKPKYENWLLDSYRLKVGITEESDPIHFAPSIIRQIQATPGQELASHTFSHYYCDEAGQDLAAFRADLQAAQDIAARDGVRLRSLVFPRNQVVSECLALLPEAGIDVYRGNPPRGFYHLPSGRWRTRAVRAVRLLDSYLNLTGHHTVPWAVVAGGYPSNVWGSRFLRPYNRKAAVLEPLRRRRIISSIRAAGRRGEVFHLWWHPHNFGLDLEANLVFLNLILDELDRLRETCGMRSFNMADVADIARRT